MEQRLIALDVPATIDYFSGGHFNMDHRYAESLPRLLASE